MNLTNGLLLCMACLMPLIAQDKSADVPRPRSYLAWWNQSDMQQELALSDQDWQQVQEYFERFVIDYNAKRSEVVISRKQLQDLYLVADQSDDDLRQFFETHIAKPERELQYMRLDFRLFLRSKLSKSTITKLAQSHPQLFTSRWMPVSKIPIRKLTPQ